MILVLEQRLDFRIRRRKGRIFFEILVLVRQHDPLAPFSVGEMELPFRIEQNVLADKDVKPLVGQNIAESAYFGDALENARAFDIEE